MLAVYVEMFALEQNEQNVMYFQRFIWS